MDQVLIFIQKLEIHPVVDHFTIGLLTTAVLIELVGRLAPNRTWIGNTALTLFILGALAAGGSFFTGDMEADRIWKALGTPAQDILKRHAMLGEYMAISFGVLALWRILIASFAFMEGSRTVFLILAIVCATILNYVGHLGGSLVYNYGAGTALMASQPIPDTGTPLQSPAPSEPSTLPTVTAATATPTAAVSPASASTPSVAPATSPAPMPSSSPTPAAAPSHATGATL